MFYSLGIGRSGTFVLVDSVLKMVRKELLPSVFRIEISFQIAYSDNPNDISLVEVLAHIRTQRHGLIQTAEQLR